MNKDAAVDFLPSCTSGGCEAKIGPAELWDCVSGLPLLEDANLLIGFDSSDDAAVY